MRIFLDTNVLISAFVSRGLCADLFRIVVSEYELILGEFVIEELSNKLEKKFKLPKPEVAEIVSFLRQFECVPVPEKSYDIACPDQDDCWVIASAIGGKAKYLVSGDSDLLNLPRIMKIKILSPRGFMDSHNKRKIK